MGDGAIRSYDEARRHAVYLVCSLGMALSMLVLVFNALGLLGEVERIVYWGETGALVSFGIAWTVSGKFIPGVIESR